MVLGERELFREGPAERGYCDEAGSGSEVECDRVLTKVLAGYSYGRGSVSGGLTIDPSSGFAAASGVGSLRISLVSAALPGGALALATLDGALGDAHTRRLRATLVDAEGLFFCSDAQSGSLVLPVWGMFTRACEPNAVLAIDLGLLAMQWDTVSNRLLGEWVRFGPAVELLGNGFGYAHLWRSIELALPFDLRTLNQLERHRGAETSLGAGLRVSAFYRTPQWETRLSVRHRTALVGGAGALRDNSIEGELAMLHNFFFTDAVVLQAGLAVRACWSQHPERTFAVWASANRHATAFAGFHLGWVHEAPDI